MTLLTSLVEGGFNFSTIFGKTASNEVNSISLQVR